MKKTSKYKYAMYIKPSMVNVKQIPSIRILVSNFTVIVLIKHFPIKYVKYSIIIIIIIFYAQKFIRLSMKLRSLHAKIVWGGL